MFFLLALNRIKLPLFLLKTKLNIMPILKIFLITIVLIIIVVLALSVRLLFTKKGEFRGGSCSTRPSSLNDQNIGCGCGSHSCSS